MLERLEKQENTIALEPLEGNVANHSLYSTHNCKKKWTCVVLGDRVCDALAFMAAIEN